MNKFVTMIFRLKIEKMLKERKIEVTKLILIVKKYL